MSLLSTSVGARQDTEKSWLAELVSRAYCEASMVMLCPAGTVKPAGAVKLTLPLPALLRFSRMATEPVSPPEEVRVTFST